MYFKDYSAAGSLSGLRVLMGFAVRQLNVFGPKFSASVLDCCPLLA